MRFAATAVRRALALRKPLGVGLCALILGPVAVAGAQDVRPPSRVSGTTTARILIRTQVRAQPGGHRYEHPLATTSAWSHQPHVLMVLASTRVAGVTWLRVRLPTRPNRAAGWIPAANVDLSRTPYWVDVHLRTRTVTVYRLGRDVRRFRAVVGAPGTPTPYGLAAVYERNPQPGRAGFLGPWALGLTAHSDVLENYGGGPGRVAIHGRGGVSLRDPLGTARSHGCVRVDNADVSWLAGHLPLGTPVQVRP